MVFVDVVSMHRYMVALVADLFRDVVDRAPLSRPLGNLQLDLPRL